jgi:elongation factor G
MLNYNPNVTMPFISSAAYQCAQKALKKAECIILQPVMKLDITTTNEFSSKVHSDLTRRHATELYVDSSSPDMTNITACVPLASIASYSSELRKLTSGNTTFNIQFDSYKHISQKEYNILIQKKVL